MDNVIVTAAVVAFLLLTLPAVVVPLLPTASLRGSQTPPLAPRPIRSPLGGDTASDGTGPAERIAA